MSDYDPNFVPVKQYALVGQKIIVTNKSRILILQRSQKAGGGGLWSIPGGGLDNSENPLESIKREIVEETKLQVSEIKPFTLKSYTHKKDFIVIIGYIGKSKSEKATVNWEHTNYKWVDKEAALKEKLTDDARFFIEQFK